MKLLKIIFIILIFIPLYNCGQKENVSTIKKTDTNLNFEKKVFDEVFLEIVDSTHKDGRVYLTFLPGMDFEKRKAKFEKDTCKLVFAITDFTWPIWKESKKEIIDHFKNSEFTYDDNKDVEKFIINLEKFSNSKYIFKYKSKFPKGDKYKIWETKYDFEFAGALVFSRIQFTKNFQKGVLAVSYGCGVNCGWNYLVFIRKENKKWIVENVKVTSMS
jgi:hypothetical protein